MTLHADQPELVAAPLSGTPAVDSLAPARLGEPQLTIIEPHVGWQPIHLSELWRYRDLLWILAMRDIKVRYKQTILGAAWAVLQPVLTMIVFTIFFGRLGDLQKYTTVPYALVTLCALLPWQFFAGGLSNAGNSLIGNQNLITKVYFPRLVIPIASIAAGLVDLAICFGVLLVFMLFYGIVPGVTVLLLPVFAVLALLATLAAGLWLSALNVEYRDVRFTIPFLIQFWMFLSPVAYPSSIVPEQWRTLYALNPLVGVIEGFQWAILGQQPPGGMILVSSAMTMALLVGGLFYFRRMEKSFADVV